MAIEAAIDVGGRFGIVSRQPAIIADSNNTLVHLAPSPPVAKVGTSTIRAFDSTTLEREVAVASYLAVRRAPVVHPTLRSGRKPAMFPEADAERLAFPGSPTIRVAGSDIDEIDNASFGLSCRAYRHENGRISPLPPRDKIQAAVRRMLADDSRLSA